MTVHAAVILGYLVLVLVAGRRLGVTVCAVVVAAEWLGGTSTVGVSEQAFATGTLQPILYNLATAAGMVLIGFTVAAHYRARQVHTVSEMLEALFGPGARTVSAAAFLVAYITLSYVQLQTCAGILAPLLGVTWTTAVLLSATVITAYTYAGGMHALAVTGVLYLVTMYLGLGVALINGLWSVGGPAALQERLVAIGGPEVPFNPFSRGPGEAVALLLGGLLGGMAAQASIQPIFAARDVATARRASILAGLIVAPFGVMTALLGLIAKTGLYFDVTEATDGKTVLAQLLMTPEFIHPVLGGLALAGVLAAILSTVGPVNFAVVTIAAKDFYHALIAPRTDDATVVAIARRLVVVVALVTAPMAIVARGEVLDTVYISYAIRAIGAIVILLALYARGWITPLGTRLAFAIGTPAVLLSVAGARSGWFELDKTYVSVGATLAIVGATTCLERWRARSRMS
jgi:SSS family solute:Na+ symporter